MLVSMSSWEDALIRIESSNFLSYLVKWQGVCLREQAYTIFYPDYKHNTGSIFINGVIPDSGCYYKMILVWLTSLQSNKTGWDLWKALPYSTSSFKFLRFPSLVRGSGLKIVYGWNNIVYTEKALKNSNFEFFRDKTIMKQSEICFYPQWKYFSTSLATASSLPEISLRSVRSSKARNWAIMPSIIAGENTLCCS